MNAWAINKDFVNIISQKIVIYRTDRCLRDFFKRNGI